MPLALVDSNVLLDVFNARPAWAEWSIARLAEAANGDGAAVNPIIYAELAEGFNDRAELDRVLPPDRIVRLPLPWDAAWVAGRAHAAYRARGGTRASPLADFWIGAHARVEGLSILTRDVARFRTNFPGVPLIHPPGA